MDYCYGAFIVFLSWLVLARHYYKLSLYGKALHEHSSKCLHLLNMGLKRRRENTLYFWENYCSSKMQRMKSKAIDIWYKIWLCLWAEASLLQHIYTYTCMRFKLAEEDVLRKIWLPHLNFLSPPCSLSFYLQTNLLM